MTAVTIQCNKIVLNEVKDNLVLLEPSYGKTKRTFWSTQSIPNFGLTHWVLIACKLMKVFSHPGLGEILVFSFCLR